MESVAEKKEGDNKNSNTHTLIDLSSFTPNADKEAEDRQRQARDSKAGLHPLQVSLLHIYTSTHINTTKTDIPN